MSLKKMSLLAGLLLTIQNSVWAGEPIGGSGFTKESDTKSEMTFKFRDELSFIVSKQKFSNQKSASAFCVSRKSELDKEFNVLLMAMAGATSENSFLEKATTFKFKTPEEEVSGIWSWSGDGDKVMMMYNGRGTDTEEIPTSKLAEFTKVAIPAVCSKKLDGKAIVKDAANIAVEGISKVSSSSEKGKPEVSDKDRNDIKDVNHKSDKKGKKANAALKQ